MSTNLHELTKQLDVLTYNSRSVLNALIRSVMSAGSSNGWTVKRAGKPVTLTRTDIFMLSNFYTEWEYTRFNIDEFDPIRMKLDAQYAGGEGLVEYPVTYAIVKHSMIMTMTTVDVNVEDYTYWLDKVKNQVNPKLFTNTAPIPLNIRTPIYDENLSTKHFDQFETYLFPRGYYTIDTLGYSGDNTSHIGGGLEWYMDIDDKMTIAANRTIIGIQNKDIAEVREIGYTSQELLYSLAGGTDSYAYAPNSFAFGLNNQVNGDNSAVTGGNSNFAYCENSGVLGGFNNTAQNTDSVIVGGRYNFVTGANSLAANESTSVGGFPFEFRRYVTAPNASAVTECKDTFETEDGCIYTLQVTGDAGNGADTTGTIAPNQILIDIDTLLRSGFRTETRRISSGYSMAPLSYVDFKIGDEVRLSRPRIFNNKYGANMGSFLDRTVTAMEMRPYGLVVSFDTSVNTFPGVNGEVISGYAARRIAVQVPKCDDFNTFIEFDNDVASASASFGYNTVAGGAHQMVVGQSNYELMRPLFIVGNGSHYIDTDTYRHNAMVVAKSYSYMQTSSSNVNFGLSDYSTASPNVHGDSNYEDKRLFDEDFVNYGVEKYAGVYAYECDDEQNDDTRAVLRVHHNHTALGVGRSGLIAYPMSTRNNPNNNRILLEAESHEGAIGIHAGSSQYDVSAEETTVDNNWVEFYNTTVSNGAGDKSITLWALDKTGIHGTRGIELHTPNDINAEYGALSLHGKSLGALTADTSETRGLMDFQMGSPEKKQVTAFFKYPGHYFMYKNSASNEYADEDTGSNFVQAYHVIANSHFIAQNALGNGSIWSTAQLILPGHVSCGSAQHNTLSLPHPKIQVQDINYPDDPASVPSTTGSMLVQELAYLYDVKELDNRVGKQFVYKGDGTRNSLNVREGDITYVKMCQVTFNTEVASYAGATFTFSIREDNSWSTQGFVSFSLGENGMTTVDGKSIILFQRTGHNDTHFHTDKVKIYIEKINTTMCNIWFSTDSAYTFFNTFKMLSGDATVHYLTSIMHITAQPTNSTSLGWVNI